MLNRPKKKKKEKKKKVELLWLNRVQIRISPWRRRNDGTKKKENIRKKSCRRDSKSFRVKSHLGLIQLIRSTRRRPRMSCRVFRLLIFRDSNQLSPINTPVLRMLKRLKEVKPFQTSTSLASRKRLGPTAKTPNVRASVSVHNGRIHLDRYRYYNWTKWNANHQTSSKKTLMKFPSWQILFHPIIQLLREKKNKINKSLEVNLVLIKMEIIRAFQWFQA